jgi:hypothetical protein
MPLSRGEFYRTSSWDFAARVIEPPQAGALAPPGYPHLVESLVCHQRWYVSDQGVPAPLDAPTVLINQKIDKKSLVTTASLILLVMIGTPLAFWIDAYVQSRMHR